ncbi:hypothetical protein [Anaeromusa acidaminophila]|uniref:hypothetical protein n=1 Tax=Anaeromusa acidaminophila TaxID=81464 RepID=UPI0003802530|nr:hypothetical protein [Anaeromusa acidaminophila]
MKTSLHFDAFKHIKALNLNDDFLEIIYTIAYAHGYNEAMKKMKAFVNKESSFSENSCVELRDIVAATIIVEKENNKNSKAKAPSIIPSEKALALAREIRKRDGQ